MKDAGVRFVMFTSDNFNKYPQASELLERMIEERIRIPFFVQCDVQVSKDEAFIELLGRAGCFQMFVGVESFRRQTLIAAHKAQNHPETYGEIIRLCRKNGITTHFSNIIGFPGDSTADIREHLTVLRALDPDVASFYILTPVPGTEQYGDFLEAGIITEPNLDRWLSAMQLEADRLLVHIDLDVLDPRHGRANEYAADGGLSPDDILRVIEIARRRFTIVALELASFDPSCDEDGRVAAIGAEIVRAIC